MSPQHPQTLEGAMQAIAAAQAQALASGVALRTPPPAPTTCCGRGCAGCVWESWFGAVAWWLDEAASRCAPGVA